MHRRRVLGDHITYVGLDVHKDWIAVAVAEGGVRGEVRDYGRIANTPAALQRLAGKLGREGWRCGSAIRPGRAVMVRIPGEVGH